MAISDSTTSANLILLRNGKPYTTSLIIADVFERRHDNVLRSIRKAMATDGGLLIREESYINERGKEQPMFVLDKRSALIIMPFIGGRKSQEGQTILVDAFLALENAVKWFLRPEPTEWERRFPAEFYYAVCGLFGWKYTEHRPLPDVIGQITRRWVYQPVVPRDVLEALDGMRGREKLHQWITDGGLPSILKQIDAVAMMARSSMSYREFEARCATAFNREPLQVSMFYN